MFGAPSTLQLAHAETAVFAAYCRSCKQSLTLTTGDLRESALSGVKEVHAVSALLQDRLRWTPAAGRSIRGG